jgi:hypothetical protein
MKTGKRFVKSGFFSDTYEDVYNTMAEMSDVDVKADRSSVDAKINNVESKIKTESNNREEFKRQLENQLSSFNRNLETKVDKILLEKMKNEILSNDRLIKEQYTLQSLFELLIERIHKECSIEYEKIKKEVDTFKAINLNKELQTKLLPLDQSLKILISKTEATSEQLKNIAPLKTFLAATLEFQNKLSSAKTEINALVNKYAEERKIISTVYEENKRLKKDVVNLKDALKIENQKVEKKLTDLIEKKTKMTFWNYAGWIFVIILSVFSGINAIQFILK